MARPVKLTPLPIGSACDGRAVVVHCPDGQRIFLSPEAAEKTAQALGRTADDARRAQADRDNVRDLPCRPIRRVLVLWSNWCARQRRKPLLRWIVALMLFPLVWGTSSSVVVGIFATLRMNPTQVVSDMAWALVGSGILAALSSWLIAPLVMSRDELRPEPVGKFRPRLV